MSRYPDSLRRWHDGWPKFWERFGVTLSDEDLVLPKYSKNHDWSIVQPKALTNTRAFEICTELFPTGKVSDDLELFRPANLVARRVDRARVILTPATVEPDYRLVRYSPRMIWREKIPVLTLKPYLILHARYFLHTHRRHSEGSRHLDVRYWTLCAGSRDSGGGVPCADWRPGNRWLYVDWARPGYRHDGLRSRSASF